MPSYHLHMSRAAVVISIVREWPDPVVSSEATTLGGVVEEFLASNPAPFMTVGPCDNPAEDGKCAGHAGPFGQEEPTGLREVTP